MLAPLLPDEEERLKELACYGGTDSPPEPALDRITQLAAQIFQVPYSLVTLVDQERQWHKSHHGTDLLYTERESAFCAHAILSDATLVAPDATRDLRFADNPLVTGPPGIRFYAGAPLITPHGHRLGTLCVLDTRPRELDPAQVAILEGLAALVMHELELRAGTERSLIELERRKRADTSLRATRDELEARVQQRTGALMEAEARYRGLFENAAEGMYQARSGEGLLSVNPAFADLLGYASPAVLLAAKIDAARVYVRPGEYAEFRRRLETEGVVSRLEAEIYRTDGTRLWVSENAHLVRDAAGGAAFYEGTVTDITPRKVAEDALRRAHEELEDRVGERTAELALLNGDLRLQIIEREKAEAGLRRSESQFRALIENAQDLTSIVSPEGVVLYKSPSVKHLLGYEPEELVGRNIFEGRLHPDDLEPVRRHLRHVLESGERYVQTNVRLRHKDDSWRLLESISSPLPPDSPLPGVVFNSRDITDRHRAEQAMLARSRQQAAVAELGRVALQGLDLPALFDQTVTLLAPALGVELTSINELLPEGGQMVMRAGFGWRAGVVGRAVVDHWRGRLPADEAPTSRPLLVDGLDAAGCCFPVLPESVLGVRPVSAASATIHVGGRPYGTICVLTTARHEFSPGDAVFLQTVADLLSTVIESRRHEAATREMEARFHRIAANTPGMVYQAIRHADGTMSLPFVSEGCRQICELEPAELQANPHRLNDLIHPEDRPGALAAIRANLLTLAPHQWEGRHLLPSGKILWITARSRPERLPNGDVIRDGLLLDVTELKRAQEEMRIAKEEAEEANRAKSEFLSRMSHELRTPLNAILGFGQLLALEDLPPMQGASVEQILRGGRHLLELINEVLDIARIEAGGVELATESLDAHAALAEAARFVKPLAVQNRVGLAQRHPRRPVWVRADRGRLNQVLLNLVSNAIKYNRPGGRVRLSCERREGGTVRLRVADTGPGLTPGEIQRLFTPFQRLGAPERGVEGTGLGLAICRSLATAMGGSIGVESAPGRGSMFYLDLPAADAPAPDGPPGQRQGAAARADALAPFTPIPTQAWTHTVLHIDDQPANLSLVERILAARANLRLLSAGDARQGLDLARAHRPDLILLDLHLPDLPGDEVVRRLRNEERTRAIPVVILSADATPAQVERLGRLGVRGYVTKPFKIRELLDAVEEQLK